MDQRSRSKSSKVVDAIRALVVFSLLLLLSPLLIILFSVHFAQKIMLYALLWGTWYKSRKCALVVTSESTIWKDDFGKNVVDKYVDNVLVLNWSDRKRWRFSLSRSAFRHFGGDREFVPLVIYFKPFHRNKYFRFYSAYKEWKHGKPEALELLLRELTALLDRTLQPAKT
jgi:hypothetical protein